jgi:adenylate cyclase class 2
MLEVEVKFAVDDLPALAGKVEERGAIFLGRHSEADQYFRPPDRDFAKTDEALRIRQIGDTTRITYKGPRLDASTKTRTEIEVPLGDGKAARASVVHLLEALGFQIRGRLDLRQSNPVRSAGGPVSLPAHV